MDDNYSNKSIPGEVAPEPVPEQPKGLELNELCENKHKRKFSHIIFIGGIGLCAVAAVAGLLLYIADRSDDVVPETITTAASIVDPNVEIIKPLGYVSLSGTFGSAKIDFSFDAENGRGERHYTLQSNEVYTLILKSAANNGDDSYTVEIKELLKGRIEIGTYTGVLSSDSFKGQYISSHGDIREVNLH